MVIGESNVKMETEMETRLYKGLIQSVLIPITVRPIIFRAPKREHNFDHLLLLLPEEIRIQAHGHRHHSNTLRVVL